MDRSCSVLDLLLPFYSLLGELVKPFNYAKPYTTVCLFRFCWVVFGFLFVLCCLNSDSPKKLERNWIRGYGVIGQV